MLFLLLKVGIVDVDVVKLANFLLELYSNFPPDVTACLA